MTGQNPEYPDVPNWRDSRTGATQVWRDFADRHGIFYPEEATRGRIIVNVQRWIKRRDGDEFTDAKA